MSREYFAVVRVCIFGFLLSLASSLLWAEDDFVLVGGADKISILVGSDEETTVNIAANILREDLGKLGGARPTIVNELTAVSPAVILIGTTEGGTDKRPGSTWANRRRSCSGCMGSLWPHSD